MPLFRKKPVIVEAEQFTTNGPLPHNSKGPVVCHDELGWYVTTIHNQRTSIEYGDWIVLEPNSIYLAYPVKPDIFENSYERM